MKVLIACVVLLVAAALRVSCLPVDPKQREQAARMRGRGLAGNDNIPGLDPAEYRRYWEEAVRNNPELARRITELQSKENLDMEQVAEMYPHFGERLARDSKNVRSQLEEARRAGIEEVRQLQRLQTMRDNNLMPDGDWMTKREAVREHLPPRFTNDDIQNRLQQQRQVLSQLDEKRAEEFKRYEMKMEHQRREKLKEMDEKKRLEAEEQFRQQQATLRQHERLRHPASKDQLEQVWEKDDGLTGENFDPRTFFFLHDTNGDKYLDSLEIEALFRNELKKVYGGNLNGMEAQEDLARMREHVVKEVDSNSDGFVSLPEFIKYTTDQGFANEEEWQPVVDKTPFSEDELQKYEDDYYDYYDYEYDSKGRVVGIKPHSKDQEDEPAADGGRGAENEREEEREGGENRNPPPPPSLDQVMLDPHGRMMEQRRPNEAVGGMEENVAVENDQPHDSQNVAEQLNRGQAAGGEDVPVDAAVPVDDQQQQNNVGDAPVKMDDIKLDMNAAAPAAGHDGRAQQFEKNPGT